MAGIGAFVGQGETALLWQFSLIYLVICYLPGVLGLGRCAGQPYRPGLPIWLAVVVLALEGFRHLLRQRRRSV